MISSYKHKAFPLLLLVFSAFSIFAEDNQPTFVGINALTDASSKSLALRVLGTAGDENTEGELKILVLTPKLSNINTSNKRDLIVNIQDALVENFNSYENVKAFYDDEKSDALYNFLQTTSISNYADNAAITEISSSAQYALIPIVYRKSSTIYYLSLGLYNIQSGKRIAYTKTEKYETVNELYAVFGGCDTATASICSALKLHQSASVITTIPNNTLDLDEKSLNELNENVKLADEAYNKKDYKTALKYYKQASKYKTAYVQNRLGDMYCLGLGTSKNYATAMSWYKKAACQNNVLAQTNLGLMYENGIGVNTDLAMAVVWYEKAATQNATAQTNLGFMYENAKGVVQDYEKAFELYQKAAEQGNAIAQNNLGVMYENGRGVKQDFTQAISWYQKSAEQGNVTAQCNLGIMYDMGKGGQQSYSTAYNWYKKASDGGNAVAQNNLGILYMYGLGVNADRATAKSLYEKAKAQGDVAAKNNLDILNGSTSSVVSGYSKAVIWYSNGSSCFTSLQN